MSTPGVSAGPDRASKAFIADVEVFRRGLRALAEQPEFVRAVVISTQLRTNLSCPYVTQDEIFTTVFGPEGPSRFWEIECSEPVEVLEFARMLAVTGATERDPTAGTVQERDNRFDRWNVAVIAAVFDAFKAGETWFVGDTSSLSAAVRWEDVQVSDALKLDARRAAEWLLRMPKRRHLVPRSLAIFLSPSDGPGAAPRLPLEEVITLVREMFNRPGAPPKVEQEVIPFCAARGVPSRMAKAAAQFVRAERRAPKGRPPLTRA
jgi:hypothetical protein